MEMKKMTFKNDEEALQKLKEIELLSKTKTASDLSSILYRENNANGDEVYYKCEILGYNWKETPSNCINKTYENLIIKANGEIFDINIDALKEMQKNSSTKKSVIETEPVVSNNSEQLLLDINQEEIKDIPEPIITNVENEEKEYIIAHLITGIKKGVIVNILKDKIELLNDEVETAIVKGFNNATGLNLDNKTIMQKHYVNTYTSIRYYNDDEYFDLNKDNREFSLEHKTTDYIFTNYSLLQASIDKKNHNRVVSIDFETASGKRASVCSIGFVVEEDGKILKEEEILVNPNAEFTRSAMRIHNIKPEDVSDSPTWDEAWPQVEEYITPNTLVVAHNIRSMELSCIRQECERYNMDVPDFAKLHSKMAYDTLRLSRDLIPGLKSYKLNDLADIYNIELNHHNALSDAKACLELFNKLQGDINFSNVVKNLESKQETKSKSNYSYKFRKDYSKILKPNTDEFDENHVCFDKKFIFTGDFSVISREDANQSVLDLGGRLGISVTMDTDYLVLGTTDFDKLSSGKMTSKSKKAFEYQEKGTGIQIISEDDFLQMII